MTEQPPHKLFSAEPDTFESAASESGIYESAPPMEQLPGDTRRSGLGAVVLHHTVTALMLILILSLGIWSYLTFRSTGFFQTPDPSESFRLEDYAATAQKQRLEFALEVFHRLDGRYPLALNELVERHLLAPSDLNYPAAPGDPQAGFVYERTAEGYSLHWTRATPKKPI